MLRPFLILLTLLFTTLTYSQEFLWSKAIGGPGQDFQGTIAKTPDGGFIHFNSFSSTILIGDSLYNTGNINGYDFLVFKTNLSGDVLWSKHFTGNGQNYCEDVSVDQSTGDIYLLGSGFGTWNIGSVTVPNVGGVTVLIALDSVGETKWVETLQGNNSYADQVEIDNAGNVYLSGRFLTSLIVGPDTLTKYDTTQVNYTPYIAKFDTAGAYQWSKAFKMGAYSNPLYTASSGKNIPFGINSNGTLFVGVNFKDRVVFDSDTISSSYPFSEDFLMVRMSALGVIDTFEHYTGASQESVTNIFIDQNDRVFFTGKLSQGSVFGTTTVPTGIGSLFLAEFTNGGSVIYTTSSFSRGHYIKGDTLGNLYLTGGFSGQLSLAGSTFSLGSGIYRSFVAKYNIANQTWDWIQASNPNSSTSTQHFFSDIEVVDEDNLVISGRFNAGLMLGNELLGASGAHDALLTRISKCDQLNATLTTSVNSGCAASSAVLTSTNSADYTYTWYANGGAVLNSDTNQFTAITSGNYFVVIDSLGCLDSSAVYTFTQNGSTVSASQSNFSPICENANPVQLSGGLPVGGVYSGSGVANGQFDPSLVSTGSAAITYTYSDSASGCADSVTKNIAVNAAPFIVMLPLDTACSNQSAVSLNVGFPSGGTYSGSGVSGSSLDPSQASLGSNTIYYTRSNSNCSATDSVVVEVVSPPQISFSINSPLCENASPVTLSAIPSGGTFSGNGVSGNFLVPQLLNPGSNTVSYSVTGNGCTSSTTATVFIDTLPLASLSPLTSVCESATVVDLSPLAFPSGGVFVGNGVSGSLFDPSVAGNGTHIISYVVSNSCGSDTASQQIEVYPNPTITFPALADICIDQSPVFLSIATPSGGVFSGMGVSGSSFDPAIAGVGTFNLNYVFIDSNGCSDSATSSITVNDLPVVSLDTLGGICNNRIPFSLNSGTPTGGAYSGSGVSGSMFDPSLVAVGNYNLTYQFTDANGCSNSDFIQVEVKVTFEDTLLHVSCDSFTTVLGNTYYTSGIYIDSLLSLGNCDSVIVRNITINNATIDTILAIVCDSFTSVTNQVYATSGVYFDTLTNVFGCDSVIRTELTINTLTTETIAPIACDMYTSPTGQVLTMSGVYTDSLTNANGCDSILTINLTINNSTLDTIQPVVCDIYTSPASQIISSTGIYFDTLSTINGCDSVIRIELTVNNSSLDTVMSSTCNSYTSAGGVIYSTSGFYTENYTNVFGCDSMVVEDVTILNLTTNTISPVVCDSYTSPTGKIFSITGTYADTLTNAVGCDSVITIQLQVNYSSLDSIIATACDSLFNPISNQWITVTGIYTDSLISVSGCDSIWMTFVNINTTTVNLFPVTSCDSFNFPGVGTFFSSQIVYDTVPGSNGCDYITGYDITIINSISQTVPVVSCDSFVSPAGIVYTTSGIFPELFTGTNGCDSTVNYDVTINLSAASLVTEVVCDSYTSPSGIVYSSTGIFDEMLATSQGCDSIASYDVTINLSVSDTIPVSACDSFTSPFGAVYNTSGFFSELAFTTSGCDSLVTYDVDINPTKLTTITETSCGFYETPLGAIFTSSGIYQDTTNSITGCDSIVTYDLTIGQLDTIITNETSCGPFTSSWGEIFNETGTYADTSATILGCDSINVLHLTISEVDVSVTIQTASLLANADSLENSFQWFNCEDAFVPIAGETNAVFTPSLSGDFAVEVTNQDNCVDTSDCVFLEKVGIKEFSFAQTIKIFPNPTKRDLNIQFEKAVDQVKVELRNNIGQLVQEQNFTHSQSLNLQINGAAGIYFLKVISGGEALDYRVVLH
jgi:hypothetical protein